MKNPGHYAKQKIENAIINISQKYNKKVIYNTLECSDIIFKDACVSDIKKIRVPRLADYQWNAAVPYGDCVYGIPSGAEKIIVYNSVSNEYTVFGELGVENKKWTGGGAYNGYIYGFPRTSSDLLQIDPIANTAKRIELGCHYKMEHHYGGVICDGKIYQPPRDTNHILIIDLVNFKTERVYLSRLPLKYRYCGSLLHPNGKIYFIPEQNQKVIEFDPNTNQFTYFGTSINCTTFSVCLDKYGNMYGFSAYNNGILYINIHERTVQMIHEEIGCAGVYKNILYYNGKIYGLAGTGNRIWEFDSYNDTIKVIYTEGEFNDVPKIASGCIINDSIIGLPAKADFIYCIQFNLISQGGV